MRNELQEIRQIDHYLRGRLNEPECDEVETRLMMDFEFAARVDAQREAMALIRKSGRRELRAKLDGIFVSLMSERTFSQQINNIFS